LIHRDGRAGVAREHRDELAGERPDGRHVAGHVQQAGGGDRVDQRGTARRDRGPPGAQVGHRGRQGVDQLVDVQQVAHVVLS
jgi:hypothetical protein